jgi:hypothetical protein
LPRNSDPLDRIDNELIDRTMDALERLMRMFAAERILYLICTTLSFVLLAVCIVSLISTRQLNTLQLTGLFSATGIIAASAGRVSFFLNKAFNLISSLVEHLAGMKDR